MSFIFFFDITRSLTHPHATICIFHTCFLLSSVLFLHGLNIRQPDGLYIIIILHIYCRLIRPS